MGNGKRLQALAVGSGAAGWRGLRQERRSSVSGPAAAAAAAAGTEIDVVLCSTRRMGQPVSHAWLHPSRVLSMASSAPPAHAAAFFPNGGCCPLFIPAGIHHLPGSNLSANPPLWRLALPLCRKAVCTCLTPSALPAFPNPPLPPYSTRRPVCTCLTPSALPAFPRSSAVSLSYPRAVLVSPLLPSLPQILRFPLPPSHRAVHRPCAHRRPRLRLRP